MVRAAAILGACILMLGTGCRNRATHTKVISLPGPRGEKSRVYWQTRGGVKYLRVRPQTTNFHLDYGNR
jgi:hypothetical protein